MKFYNLLKGVSVNSTALAIFGDDKEDYCLNLFNAIHYYNERIDTLDLFYKSLRQNVTCTIKILIYIRDIKNGLGKRNLFRKILASLAVKETYIAKQLMYYIPSFGRYDDLFVLLKTPLEEELITYVKSILYQDLENIRKGEPISLLAKWMPSINASNKEVVKMGRYFASRLNLSEQEYRKILSELRKGIIVENNLRIKDYDIDYTRIPSSARYKYKDVFLRNDTNKYIEYLQNKKINDDTNMYMINKEIYGLFNLNELNESKIKEIESRWEKYFAKKEELNTLVVRDGSISMYCNKKVPILIVDALALYYSSKLKGMWKNKVVNFSEEPEFIDLDQGNVYLNIKKLEKYSNSSNLDIEKLLLLILTNMKKDLERHDKIDRILIVSDLEFEIGVNNIKKLKAIKKQFNKLHIDIPQIIYWNVNAKNVGFENNKDVMDVKFINGVSKDLVDLVVENKRLDNVSLLNKCISKYNFVDKMDI